MSWTASVPKLVNALARRIGGGPAEVADDQDAAGG
jgi:hypothetical protein